jgi:Ca-activated chloride channel family protein
VRSGLGRYLDRRALVVAGVVVLLPALVLLPGRIRIGAGAASCDGPSTTLSVLASPGGFSEQLQARAKAFMASGPQVGEACARIQVLSKSPGGTLEAFERGWDPRADGPAPDVWAPSSSARVWLLNDQLHESGKHSPITGQPATVALSPMVIAMPRPMAVALGWPKAQVGWSELLDLARSRKGWGEFGHPEWGKFKLGKTNPNLSDSGLAATLTAYYAATRRTSSLSAQDLRSLTTRRFVAGVEQSVAHYGDSDTTFLSDLRRADDQGKALSYVSAVVTEERMVWQYNQGNPSGDPAALGRRAKPKVPLAAVYPKEGTLLADHPYAIVTKDPAKRAAADAFLAYLHSDDVQQALQRDGFRDRQVTAGGLALEDGGILPDQPKVVMPLPDPKVIDLVLKGWPALRKHSNVLTLMDTSGSMNDPVPGAGVTKLTLAKRAVKGSLDLFTDDDRVGLWQFSDEINGSIGWKELVPVGPLRSPFHGDAKRDVMLRYVDDLQASGGTALYNSTLAAWRALRERYQPDAVNVLLVVSDGVDSDTETIGLQALLSRLESEQGSRPVRIITIAYGQGADRNALRKIADASGGTAYQAIDPTDIEEVFAEAIAST